MKVERYELQPWVSGQTTAGITNFTSQRLFLNDICISGNIPNVEIIENLMQIEICLECFEPGCSSSGYVQVFYEGQTVVWKYPFNEDFNYFDNAASALENGTIFWNIGLHESFLKEFGEVSSLKRVKLSGKQAFDLWRLNACRILFPWNLLKPIEEVEEEIMGFYSIDDDSNDLKTHYLKAKNIIQKAKDIRLIDIQDKEQDAQTIIAMFETNPYKEWKCLLFDNGTYYYPICDDYLIEIIA